MVKEVKYYCDECKGEISQHNSTTITILAHQGADSLPSATFQDRGTGIKEWGWHKWDYKVQLSITLCDDCLGEEVKHTFGHCCNFADYGFSLKAHGRGILRKLGLLKALPTS